MSAREEQSRASQRRLLDAAFEVFASKGYDGARVEAIAAVAGLNKQLISHHFGGKAGLYQAVLEDRMARSTDLPAGGDVEVPVALAMLFDNAASDPQWMRILLWEALAGSRNADDDQRRERYTERRSWIEVEQAAGNLPADLDPELLLLSLFGAALYPALVPHVAELVTGLKADSATFQDRYRQHLELLAQHLGR